MSELEIRAFKALITFSNEELLRMIKEYPNIRHLREGLSMRKILRVYIASPYNSLLNRGVSLQAVKGKAREALSEAKAGFFSSRFEFFSPVLTFRGQELSRDEAMRRCFNELMACEFLFIPSDLSVLLSEGIYEEYKFARKNGIVVIFADKNIRARFEARGKNENKRD